MKKKMEITNTVAGREVITTDLTYENDSNRMLGTTLYQRIQLPRISGLKSFWKQKIKIKQRIWTALSTK